jgi:hypothetical protein
MNAKDELKKIWKKSTMSYIAMLPNNTLDMRGKSKKTLSSSFSHWAEIPTWSF